MIIDPVIITGTAPTVPSDNPLCSPRSGCFPSHPIGQRAKGGAGVSAFYKAQILAEAWDAFCHIFTYTNAV